MLTLWVKLKAGIVISYVVDFLLIVQWIAVLICWRKQKTLQFLHDLFIYLSFTGNAVVRHGRDDDLTLSSKDKNLAQWYLIPAVALRKSQPLKLCLIFYSLAERLPMFSAKLNAVESILLYCIFLQYQYVATVAFTSKGFAPNRRL